MRPITLLLLFFLISSLNGQDLRSLYDSSMVAFKEKDYKRFKELNLKALQLHPSQPTILNNTALAYDKLNKLDSCRYFLSKLVSWNASLSFEGAGTFENIKQDTSLFNSLNASKARFRQKLARGSVFTEIAGQYHFEDMVKVGGLIYVTDVLKRQLLKIDPTNQDITPLANFDLSAMAVLEDIGDTAWVSTGDLLNTKEKEKISTLPALIKIDLNTGKEISEIPLPEGTVVGDMIHYNESLLLASNSARPEIFIVDKPSAKIIRTLPLPDAFNLQGITLDEQSKRIYLADYIKGICSFFLDREEERQWLESPDYLLKGIDGLNFVDSSTLIAIQNSSEPRRVVLIEHTENKVMRIDLLENNLDGKGEPTNGIYLKELGFFYIANSAWPFYNKEMQPMQEGWENQKIRFLPYKVLKLE